MGDTFHIEPTNEENVGIQEEENIRISDLWSAHLYKLLHNPAS